MNRTGATPSPLLLALALMLGACSGSTDDRSTPDTLTTGPPITSVDGSTTQEPASPGTPVSATRSESATATPAVTGPGLMEPQLELSGLIIDATVVAVVSAVPDPAVLGGTFGHYRIVTDTDLDSFLSRFQNVDGAAMFTPAMRSEARSALAQGQVLAAGIVHQGCTRVEQAFLVKLGDFVELSAANVQHRESSVSCDQQKVSVVVLATSPSNLPVGAMAPADDIPAPDPGRLWVDPPLTGRLVYSTEVAIGAGSVAAPAARGPYRISTAEQLDRFAGLFPAPEGGSLLPAADLELGKLRLAAGQVLVGGVAHAGCFPARSAVLSQGDDGIEMVAAGTDPEEETVDCESEVTTVAVLASTFDVVPASAMASAADLPNS